MDIENLLKLLKECEVRFVIIGVAAFSTCGYACATVDVDLVIESSQQNTKNCLTALKNFGCDINEISIAELLRKKILIRRYLVEVDIHPFVAGVEFEDIWKHKVREKIGKVETYSASLDDLIKMKRAAGRLIDKEDLKMVLELKKKRR